jgi:hypothetical protein
MKVLTTSKNKAYKTLLGISFFGCIVAFTIVTQLRYDALARPEQDDYAIKITKHVMPSNIVRNFSFGFRNILADFYWISVIQDLPGWDRDDDFYIQEYENLATLDPKFEYPYLFGILVVSSKSFATSTNQIEPVANIGIQNLPYNWEIPFYLGTQYHLQKNYQKAFRYIHIAASRPIIPKSVRNLYSVYGTRNLPKDQATQALIGTIYQTTTSTTTREVIKTDMEIRELTEQFQKQIGSFKTRTGRIPESFDELVKNGLLVIDEYVTEKFTLEYNNKTGEVLIKQK